VPHQQHFQRAVPLVNGFHPAPPQRGSVRVPPKTLVATVACDVASDVAATWHPTWNMYGHDVSRHVIILWDSMRVHSVFVVMSRATHVCSR
jgi:hypothetical protein